MVTGTKAIGADKGAEEQTLNTLLETAETEAIPEAEPEAIPEVKGEPLIKSGASKTFSQEELEAELEKRVKAEAASIKDKSLVTYQQTQTALKKEIAELKEAARREKEEAELARLEGRESEEWADTPAPVIGAFQKTRRDALKEKADFNSWVEETKGHYQSFVAASEKAIKYDTALKLAIQYGLPEGENIVKQLEAFVKEISEGSSDAEMELKALRSSLKIKERKPSIKPDSSRLSAPGGRDWSKASAEEKIAEGLKEEREGHRK